MIYYPVQPAGMVTWARRITVGSNRRTTSICSVYRSIWRTKADSAWRSIRLLGHFAALESVSSFFLTFALPC
jgi:hypothetical protein